MSGQTTVRTDLSVGTPAGMIADNTQLKDLMTGLNEEASAAIPFGVFVQKTATERGVKLVATTSDVLAGVTVWGQSYSRQTELDASGNLLPGTIMDIGAHGRFYMYPEDAVTPLSGVHVRAGGSGQVGAVRGTADSTNTIDVSKFCRWASPGSATVPAVLEVNMTGYKNATADS